MGPGHVKQGPTSGSTEGPRLYPVTPTPAGAASRKVRGAPSPDLHAATACSTPGPRARPIESYCRITKSERRRPCRRRQRGPPAWHAWSRTSGHAALHGMRGPRTCSIEGRTPRPTGGPDAAPTRMAGHVLHDLHDNPPAGRPRFMQSPRGPGRSGSTAAPPTEGPHVRTSCSTRGPKARHAGTPPDRTSCSRTQGSRPGQHPRPQNRITV